MPLWNMVAFEAEGHLTCTAAEPRDWLVRTHPARVKSPPPKSRRLVGARTSAATPGPEQSSAVPSRPGAQPAPGCRTALLPPPELSAAVVPAPSSKCHL